MVLTFHRPDIKGDVDLLLLSKDEIIYKKNRVNEYEDIQLPKNLNKDLILYATYKSPVVTTRKKRIKYFFKILLYHTLPLSRDRDLYHYKAKPCSLKIFKISQLKRDAIIEYVPFQDSSVEYDDGETSYVNFDEDIKYPYAWIPKLASVVGLLIVAILLISIAFLNLLWIKKLY